MEKRGWGERPASPGKSKLSSVGRPFDDGVRSASLDIASGRHPQGASELDSSLVERANTRRERSPVGSYRQPVRNVSSTSGPPSMGGRGEDSSSRLHGLWCETKPRHIEEFAGIEQVTPGDVPERHRQLAHDRDDGLAL